MRTIRFIISAILFMSTGVLALADNTLLIKAHHPHDDNQIMRIWRTPNNNYIIRLSFSAEKDDFEQEKLYQYQKKVEYDGFAKRVVFKASCENYYVIAHVDGEFALVYGFFSEALNDVVSIGYIIDYVNRNAFDNL